MDGQYSKRALPNTPRINDRVKDYYQNFGQDRDLEKFMRIYSPVASSQESQRDQHSSNTGFEACYSSTNSCEALLKMPSHPLSSGCCGINSKSMPNIDVHGTIGAKDIIMDINIEVEGDNGKIFSASSECIQTPIKDPLSEAKHTQTPESVAKSHRRLEWDSLGDIGYKKSMSTSNISVLERSLLKEFFKENNVTSAHENNGNNQPQVREQQKTVTMTKSTCMEHATPPLASSTLVEVVSRNATSRGARPKMISQSTSSTSLQKKFEKYAQTSLLKPPTTHSQEIQVCMSSSTSVMDETATPSSFEYRSSRSSRSSKSSAYMGNDLSNKHLPTEQHPFITSITELLTKRKLLSEKNQAQSFQSENMREQRSKFHEALEENKENQSDSQNTISSTTTSFSLTRQAPELNLGIQLICSLIDAKSLNGKQKKKLIRDIVKRITRLNDEESPTVDTNTPNGSSSRKHISEIFVKQNEYDSVYLCKRNPLEKSCQVLLNLPSDLGVTPINTDHLQYHEKANSKSRVCSTTINKTNDQINIFGANKTHSNGKHQTNNKNEHKNVLDNKISTISNKHISHQQSIATNENRIGTLNLTDIKSSSHKRNKETSSQLVNMQKRTSRNSLQEADKHLLNTRSTQTSKSSISTESKKLRTSSTSRTTTSSATTTTSSSSSRDLPTQKSLRKPPGNSNTDGDQPTMREWLNPLTQSEIEYEEKKREESARKSQEKVLKNENNNKKTKHVGERMQQLSWIENEIQRLECLKHLLIKDNNNEKSSTTFRSSDESSNQLQNTKDSTQPDKLYDTVYSDKSSVLSESAERLVKEIEFILEESNEDIINLKDKSKKTKERKKETQIVYENPAHNKCNKEKFRSVKETITINKEKLLADNDAAIPSTFPPTQRKKIATPTTSDQSPEVTKSLRDLVKQKKQDFMESYKTKKQNHYDALKQQQKEQANYKYMPLKGSQPTAFRYSGHYSIPHTINRQFSPTDYAYPQSRLPPTPEDDPQTKTSSDIVYSTATKFSHVKAQQKASTSSTTAATTSSSTSMFCISSDVSVPMGSNNSSSTPTTTHHYDDVAAAVAGVAVQTSDSILRSQPVFGPQLHPYFHPQRVHTQRFSQPIISSTAAIQVKPRGIAYVIEFEDDKNSNEPLRNLNVLTTESATTNNTNAICAIIKTSSEPQMTLQDHLERAKPKFLQHSKERKAILNQLQAMRQAREHQIREIVDNSSFNSLERRLQYLPPPPTQKIRILNTKAMKALTNKRFATLPEVVARKQREQEEKKRRGNRVLRDVFNRRLQRRMRSGKLSLNHSKTVI